MPETVVDNGLLAAQAKVLSMPRRSRENNEREDESYSKEYLHGAF
jgi:hypothetical protein